MTKNQPARQLSLRGLKSRVPRESNLIFGGTGVSPVIQIDRLEACPTIEIASGWRPRNDISRHVAFSNGAKCTIHIRKSHPNDCGERVAIYRSNSKVFVHDCCQLPGSPYQDMGAIYNPRPKPDLMAILEVEQAECPDQELLATFINVRRLTI